MEQLCHGCMKLKSGEICPHCGFSEADQNESHQLSLGTVLHGQYEVGRVLGQGGFGITMLEHIRQRDGRITPSEVFAILQPASMARE